MFGVSVGLVIFLGVAVGVWRSQARRIREQVQAGIFAGLAEEMALLCALPVERDDEEPTRLAA